MLHLSTETTIMNKFRTRSSAEKFQGEGWQWKRKTEKLHQ